MSNFEDESSGEEYSPGDNSKSRRSWPSKVLAFSSKSLGSENPFVNSPGKSKKSVGKRKSKKKATANGNQVNTGRWSQEEHELFLKAIELHGRDWKKVQEVVGTRTSTQARSHAQKVLPHPSEAEKTNPSFNSASTWLTKSSPESNKNVNSSKLVNQGMDENSSEFMVFKVEKVRKPIIGRDRVNSENNIFTAFRAQEGFSKEESLKEIFRKNSMNCELDDHQADLLMPPNEWIKERCDESDEEEAKEDFAQTLFEKKRTLEPEHRNFFEDNHEFHLLPPDQDLNLESSNQPDEFPMDIDDAIGPCNSLNIMQVDRHEDSDANMEDGSHLHFCMDVEVEQN